jgi:hypothetical protein
MKLNCYKLCRSLAIIVLALVSYSVKAQLVSPYRQFTLLRNGSQQFQATSTNAGIQVKKPVANGSIHVQLIANNTYRITYTPDNGFAGSDTLVYEFWNFINPSTMAPFTEHVIFHVKSIIPKEDFITIQMDDEAVAVDVLANDQSDLSLTITSITHASNIVAEIIGNELVIDPLSEGQGFVKYQICNDDEECVFGLLRVQILELPLTDTIFRQEFTLRGMPLEAYLGEGDYSVLLNPAHGSVTIANGLMLFAPNATYTGTDQLKLEREFEGETQIVEVQIHILPFTSPSRMVVNDRFFTSRNDALTFNVLENDLISNKPVQSFTQPSNGTLTYLGGGEFVYTPNYHYSGSDFFTYRVCAINNMNCETARVDLVVDNFLPEYGTYYLQTSKNQPFVFSYPAPIQTFDWEVLENAFQGDLVYYPGEQTLQMGGQELNGFNLMVYTPPAGFSGTDEMRIQYCAGGECRSVKVYMEVLDEEFSDCVADCIWPGDTNLDGEVNVYDVLPIAYHHGLNGPQRTEDPVEHFLPVPGDDWGLVQSNGLDVKHIDADGDGEIALSDVSVISDFYLADNQVKPITANPLLQVPIILDLATPEVEIGETAIFNIIVGTAQYPAIDFKGLAFQLNLGNATFFDTSTLSLTLYSDSWLSQDGPSTDFTVKTNGYLLDGALSRLDQKFKSGFGIIGKFEGTIVRDIGGFHIGSGDYLQIPISLKSNQTMVEGGLVYSMPAVNTTLKVKVGQKSKYATSGIRVYPNPASDVLSLSVLRDNHTISMVQLFTMSGNLVKQMNVPGQTEANIQLSDLPQGMYIAKVLTSDGVYTSKVMIQR